MDRITGRPDHITDALNTHGYAIGETPFGYGMDGNHGREQVYANLVMYGGLAKPSKASLETELVVLQAKWDEDNAPYKKARRYAYPSIGDQLDMQYHDGMNSTTTWADSIAAVKAKYPKPG